VVTVTNPPAKPDGIVAIIVVVFGLVKFDAILPKVTEITWMKVVPVRVTTVPGPALVGDIEVMIGAGMKVKMPELVAVPPGVVTVIVPVAPLPTFAMMLVALATVKEADAVPPKATAVVVKLVPEKLVPIIETIVPVPPLVGVNEVMVGARAMMKVKVGGVQVALVVIRPGVVTENVPVVPLPTVAFRVVYLVTVKAVTAVPPTVTADASVTLTPVRITTVPGPPEVGVNEVILGGR